MSAEPIDFAAVKAQHEWHLSGPQGQCARARFDPPGESHEGECLSYRLAVEANRLADKVARVETLCGWLERADRRCDGIDLPAKVTAARFRAALADQPEQAQP